MGNKLDLIPEKRDPQLHVTKEEAETLIKSYQGVTYHEVSAKDGKRPINIFNQHIQLTRGSQAPISSRSSIASLNRSSLPSRAARDVNI